MCSEKEKKEESLLGKCVSERKEVMVSGKENSSSCCLLSLCWSHLLIYPNPMVREAGGKRKMEGLGRKEEYGRRETGGDRRKTNRKQGRVGTGGVWRMQGQLL